MSGLEERERAVELYFTTPMTTAQVVEHLGYPTRQCLERWLAMDSRYAGHMAKPIIPLETRRRAVELVLGGMQQKQAAKQLGAGVGAVHGWVRAYRKGGMAALQPKNRNSAQGNKPADSRRRPSAADDDDAEALRRRVEEPEPENALMREVVEARRKRPRRRPAAPVEQGAFSQWFRLKYGFCRTKLRQSAMKSSHTVSFPAFFLITGKTKCRSGCISLLNFTQVGQIPQASCSPRFSQQM